MQERNRVERLILLAPVFQNATLISLRQALADDVSKMLFERMILGIRLIADARSLNQLRRIMGKLVLDFASINALFSARLISHAVEEGLTPTEVLSGISGEAWGSFASYPAGVFSKSDRLKLMEAMRVPSEITELGEETPPENMAGLYSAMADAYWALLKIQLGIFAASLIQSGELKPQDYRMPHWLCIALRDYVNEWRSALFANNPVLQERLSRPLDELKTISLDELERELGL